MKYKVRILPADDQATLVKYLRKSGVDSRGIDIIGRKSRNMVFRVENVSAAAANIIKQQLLSMGQEAAVHRDIISGRPDTSEVYIIIDQRSVSELAGKFSWQPFGLPRLGEEIERLAQACRSLPESIKLRDGELSLKDSPLIMGILNTTPDSFSDGGKYLEPGEAVDRALRMVDQGADIIDIGGESSRPGASDPGSTEEIRRVIPVLEMLESSIPVPVSIDTRKSEVARAALDHGARIINDISGLGHDPEMIVIAAEYGAAVVVMHMQGTPSSMQDNPYYQDVIGEIMEWFRERTGRIMEGGVEKEKIIIDPGIGFGKRLEDNLDIIRELTSFRELGFPVMIGYSRKSFLGAITGRGPEGRVYGGMAALGRSLREGAQLVRVHDVEETRDFINVFKAIEGEIIRK
ncbi:MAG: dihydropteroate synthase [Candidatus Latescibacteria bacterium]|nr:dihydropteroate synthase [bacterium]MBD3423006.1 dihydropteroate synthase [Candidatus Latescibacterota bacterium]